MSRWLPIALVVLGLLAGGASPSGADSDDRDRKRGRDRRGEVRIPVDPDVRIDIEIMSGRIEIEGWDEDEVRIRTRGNGVDALEIDADTDWVSIRGTRAGVGWLPFPISGVEVDLRIDVPKGSHIQAKTINEPMLLAAAHALSAIIPDSAINEEYILPSVFDKRVVPHVAKAVARAAIDSGVARRGKKDVLEQPS